MVEAAVGRTLVARGKGGGIELTGHGTALCRSGRALLALNDDILKAVQTRPAHEVVRLGFDSGYSRHLPDILARLAAQPIEMAKVEMVHALRRTWADAESQQSRPPPR